MAIQRCGLVVIESRTRPSNAGPPPRGRKIHPFLSRSIPGRPPLLLLLFRVPPPRLAFSFLRPRHTEDTLRTRLAFASLPLPAEAAPLFPTPNDPRVRLNVFSPSLPLRRCFLPWIYSPFFLHLQLLSGIFLGIFFFSPPSPPR